MILTHHSPKLIDNLINVSQDDYFKPNGLWVSVDDDWRRWCEQEEFNGLGQYTYMCELKANANVLHIKTCKELDQLTVEYGIIDRYGKTVIDWEDFASKYKGIIIAPYLHEQRFKTFWYYCWDCASGCTYE